MKLLLLLSLLTGIATAQSNDLSWFSSEELSFEKQKATIKTQNRSTTLIESIKLINAKTTEGLSAQLKKCNKVFRAVIKPSQEDADSLARAMKLSNTNKQDFKPSTLTIIFSTDPTCSREDKPSPLAPLLVELRQRAAAKGQP